MHPHAVEQLSCQLSSGLTAGVFGDGNNPAGNPTLITTLDVPWDEAG
jgi:hypothetical protein